MKSRLAVGKLSNGSGLSVESGGKLHTIRTFFKSGKEKMGKIPIFIKKTLLRYVSCCMEI